jgi:hypothetical protein
MNCGFNRKILAATRFIGFAFLSSAVLNRVCADSLGNFQGEGIISIQVPRLTEANRSGDRFSVIRYGRFCFATLTGTGTVFFINDGTDSFVLRIPSDPQIPHAQLCISPGWSFGDSIYAFLAAETAFGNENDLLSTNWLKQLPFLSSEDFPPAAIQVRFGQVASEKQPSDSQEIEVLGPAKWMGKDGEWQQSSPPFENGRPLARLWVNRGQRDGFITNAKIASTIVLSHLVLVHNGPPDKRTEIFQKWTAELGTRHPLLDLSSMSNLLTVQQRTLVTDWRFGEDSHQYFLEAQSQLPLRDSLNFEALARRFDEVQREKRPRYRVFYASLVTVAGLVFLFFCLRAMLNRQ